jgi:hypothetical protein
MDITADYEPEYESLKELLVDPKIDGVYQNKKRNKILLARRRKNKHHFS